MNLGDIYWVRLPPLNGREQSGRRPAIILQDQSYAGHLPVVLVVPLTGATAALRFPGTVEVLASAENGLQTTSAALVFQLRAVDRKRLEDRLGNVGDQLMGVIFQELDKLTGRSK